MKRSIMALITFCLFTFAVAASTAQGPPDKVNAARTASASGTDAEQQAELNRQLVAEIKQLRVDLLRQRLEFQQWKLRQIERELQTAQGEQQRLAEEDQAMQRELAELTNASDGLGELESLKKDLTGSRTEKLRARQQPINQRVAELTEWLSREETQRRQLADRLKAETNKTTN